MKKKLSYQQPISGHKLGQYKPSSLAVKNNDGDNYYENVVQTIKVLSLKGYRAEFGIGYKQIDAPYFMFRDGISESSFNNIPVGFKCENIFPQLFVMSYDLDQKSTTFFDAIDNLRDWAENLPMAECLSFEINVPEGTLPDEFARLLELNHHIYNHDIEDWEDGDYSLECYITTSPDNKKSLSAELQEFAKKHNVKINLEASK